jgi:hypothetical protein
MMTQSRIQAAVVAVGVMFAGGAGAQVAAGASQPSMVIVTTKDTALMGRIRAIDSLMQKQRNLPIGSPEFAAIDSTLRLIFREMPRPPAVVNGQFQISVAKPKAALGASPMDALPRGTLGFTASGVNQVWYTPGGVWVRYFEYPTVVTLEENSPASRAGVRFGDSLVAYNGLDVRAQAINVTSLLTPGREVSVRLHRDGDAREITVPVEKASDRLMIERRADAARELSLESAERRTFETQGRMLVEERAAMAATRVPYPQGGNPPAAAAGTFVPSPQGGGRVSRATVAPAASGVLGAAMVNVDKDLASSIKGMDGKQGVYVTFVPQGSLADRALGLRGGDVILRVESSEVENVGQLRVRLQAAEQTSDRIKVFVMRAGKRHELTYIPPR